MFSITAHQSAPQFPLSEESKAQTLCGVENGYLDFDESRVYTCPENLIGQYVVIEKLETSVHLVICEVEVNGGLAFNGRFLF